MGQYNKFDRVMEARNQFKNKASSENLISGENFRINKMFQKLSLLTDKNKQKNDRLKKGDQ